MKKLVLVSALALLVYPLNSCEHTFGPNSETASSLSEISVADQFSFETSTEVALEMPDRVSVADVYSYIGTDSVLMGRYSRRRPTTLRVPIPTEKVSVNPVAYMATEQSPLSKRAATQPQTQATKTPISGKFYALGSWDINGLPSYLMNERDNIPQSLVDDIGASLPETRPVPQYNPEYLNGRNMNTELRELADVWVTFVHEGAGWKNALGYFTYPLGNVPATTNDIDSLFVIFPNASFAGSGGSLQTGDKVYLGRFPENTGIGWFLIPNGFSTGTGKLTITPQIKHSVHPFNSYTQAQYNQHVILLNDAERELLLLGFEDTTRPAGDNDFNDAIFFVSSNPYRAIITENLLPVKQATDTDGDGIFDHLDTFPDDVERAFVSYFPSASGWGSLLFEDLWPAVGDYDFNDLVADYRFTYHMDSQNKIKEIQATFRLKAAGGEQQNGFFLHIPEPIQNASRVTGSQIFDKYTSFSSQGFENGQDEIVVAITDNISKTLPAPSGYKVTNVLDEQPKVNTYDITVKIEFATAVSSSNLGAAPYNPFLVANLQRSREIHLKGKVPTKLASTELFGSLDDNTNLALGLTYQTQNGLPWALNISSSIPHLKEGLDFTEGYLKFVDWAVSNGTSSSDWFTNKNGYRKITVLYTK